MIMRKRKVRKVIIRKMNTFFGFVSRGWMVAEL